MRDPNCIDKALLKQILLLLVLLCGVNRSGSLVAQVIDENNPQVTTLGEVGEDSLDFLAQSFYADIWQVNEIGVWLQQINPGGQVKFALVADTNDTPDLTTILYESPLIEPADSGSYYYSDPFVNLLRPGNKYWIVVDGYQNLLSSGYSTVGVSSQFTDTGAGMWFSGDSGQTWDSVPGIPMAIYVEGDTCVFNASITPEVPLVCETNPATLSAGFGFSSYLWSTGETTQEITVATAGTYSVTVLNNDLCVGIGFVEAIPNVIPNIILPDVTDLCNGSTVTLAVSPFFNQYLWSDGSTASITEASEPGLYWVEATSAGGCTNSDTTLVVEIPATVVDLGEDTILCQGQSIQFDPGPDFDSYDWSTGSSSRSIFVNFTVDVHVTVLDSNGCFANSDTVSVMVFPRPDTPTVSLEIGNLVSSFGFGYQWYHNGEAVAGETNQVFENPDSGFYFVEVLNAFDCNAFSDTFFIDIEPPGNFIPSGFSPNGDGVNDVFHVEAIERFPGNSLVVFNRWGEEVYRKDGYQNDWDGSGKSGGALPDGNYFYILDLGDGTPPRRGNVLINR